jgi:hypothetical protein
MLGSARHSLLPLLVLTLATPAATRPVRSDPVAIYGVVDRVVVAPDTANPNTIQLWGAFSLTDQKPGDHYTPARRGYLYFTVAADAGRQTRAEWADLRRIAGSRTIVGFGSKYERPLPRLRCSTEAPSNPDNYSIGIGVQRVVGARGGNEMRSDIERDLQSGNIAAAPCPGSRG